MKKLWLSWEDHRRSRELAVEFDAKYRPLVIKAKRAIRYPILTFWTILELVRFRPSLVFCQNPSVMLTTLLCLVKPFFRYKLCVDRHSNFKFETEALPDLKWRIFHSLSKFSVRHADLTIVTNQHLADLCVNWGGTCVVLQDKIPDLKVMNEDFDAVYDFKVSAENHVMFVTMFDDDEPIDEIIAACKSLQDTAFYFSGNYKKMIASDDISNLKESGVHFLGFIPEKEYVSLMRSCDIVCVLTKLEYVLNCGAYEAISLEKPLVLSNTKTIKNYFNKGAVYVNPEEPDSIRAGICAAIQNKTELHVQAKNFKEQEKSEWRNRFLTVNIKLRDIIGQES